jgi:hypothetical protein
MPCLLIWFALNVIAGGIRLKYHKNEIASGVATVLSFIGVAFRPTNNKH